MRNIFWYIIREIQFRWITSLLSILGLAATVAIVLVTFVLLEASERETRRVTRDLGFNLRIIPASTNLNQFFLHGFSDRYMPEGIVEKLLQTKKVTYNHLAATLQGYVTVNGVKAVVVGLAPEKAPPGAKKSPMVKPLPAGKVHLGNHIAEALKIERGDNIVVSGKFYQVTRVAPEMGTVDDIRIVASLGDAQIMLEKPGQINEIKAIDCLCLTASDNPLAILREEIQSRLPEAMVLHDTVLADARGKQRQMVQNYAAFVMPFTLIIGTIWLASLAMLNVFTRVSEIGILRGLGYSSFSVALLFIGKAILVGLIASFCGVLVGALVFGNYAPMLFPVTAANAEWDYDLCLWAMVLTPVFAVICSFLPTLIAISLDPAVSLSRES